MTVFDANFDIGRDKVHVGTTLVSLALSAGESSPP